MKNEYNKFIVKFSVLAITMLAIFIMVIVIIDPFYHYHKPIEPIKLIQEKQAYQNIGIARNCNYDTILTGSSMTENFKVSQLNELFGCDAVKLSFQGGRITNYEILFDQALKNDEVTIKKIFYGCDISAYIVDPQADIPNKIPTYLYDENIITDIKYVLNKTTMYNYALPYFKYSVKNNIPDINDAYCWYQLYEFGKDAMMAQYQRPQKQEKKIIIYTQKM